MKKQNQETDIEIESLSQEISQKSILIARLNAQMYKLAAENQKLKKQQKSKSDKK